MRSTRRDGVKAEREGENGCSSPSQTLHITRLMPTGQHEGGGGSNERERVQRRTRIERASGRRRVTRVEEVEPGEADQ